MDYGHICKLYISASMLPEKEPCLLDLHSFRTISLVYVQIMQVKSPCLF